jgi:hypothetical protein
MADAVISRVERLEDLTIVLIEVQYLFSRPQLNVSYHISLVYQVKAQFCLGWLVYEKSPPIYIRQHRLYSFPARQRPIVDIEEQLD